MHSRKNLLQLTGFLVALASGAATAHAISSSATPAVIVGVAAKLLDAPIGTIAMLGSDEKLTWSQTVAALTIDAPRNAPDEIAVVFKITPRL